LDWVRDFGLPFLSYFITIFFGFLRSLTAAAAAAAAGACTWLCLGVVMVVHAPRTPPRTACPTPAQ